MLYLLKYNKLSFSESVLHPIPKPLHYIFFFRNGNIVHKTGIRVEVVLFIMHDIYNKSIKLKKHGHRNSQCK